MPPATVSEPAPADSTQARWFSEQVQTHDASLKNYLRHSFPSVRDIDDVVQESYLRVWRRQMIRPIAEVAGSVQASVKGFLFQVARRLALDTIRHERASPFAADSAGETQALSVPAEGTGVHEAVCTNQEFALLLEAIDLLPPRCRDVVVLRKLHGLSVADTAEKLGLSEETVHVQMRRGLQRVQQFLQRRGVTRERQP